jgi:pyruvate formate lyase activating enzyme
MKVWHEIVDLVVPTLNDTEEEFKDLAKWTVDNLGPDVPLHFSKFYPTYQLKNLPDTPLKTLETARQISMGAGLNYVYIGNVNPDHEGNNTYCPKCHKMLIERYSYIIRKNDVVNGKCRHCGNKIPGVWE